MMSRVLAIPLAVLIGATAQAQQTSDQEAHKAAEKIVEAYNAAGRAKDATAMAAVYSENAILVMPDGPLVGRAAIEKYFKNAFKGFTLEAATLDHVTTIADGRVMLRTGSFSGTVQSANGPSPVRGYWATTDIREGGAWRICQEEDNIAPPVEKH